MAEDPTFSFDGLFSERAPQQAAMDADVGYHPGVNFSPDGVSGSNYARLCYGYNTPEEIHEGISRLAEVFDKAGYLAG